MARCSCVLHLPLEWFTARSEARYWLRIAILPTPPVFDVGVLIGILPCRLVWLNQNGVAIPDGEKKLTIRLFVLTESTNVTDGQMDRETVTA